MAATLNKLALRQDQLAILGSYTEPFSNTANSFFLLSVQQRYNETSFQISLLFEKWLLQLEEQKAASLSSKEIESYTAHLLNSEYVIIDRNNCNQSELRYNPFLGHWIDVVLRIQPLVLKVLNGQDVQNVPLWWAKAQAARLLLIRWALGLNADSQIDSQVDSQMPNLSPRHLFGIAFDILANPINAHSFTHLLELEGLLPSSLSLSLPLDSPVSVQSALPASSTTISRGDENNENAVTQTTDVTDATGIDTNSKLLDEEKFYHWYHESPGDALDYLIHLPPSLNELDFLTKILSSGAEVFELYNLKVYDIAREHLQRVLRNIEQIAPQDSFDDQSVHPEEQAQAIKVIVVYLKNLISCGILPLDVAFYDVEEICVRYIFLHEVREFRLWLHQIIEEAVSAPIGLGG